MQTNFTPIDHLLKKKQPMTPRSKEGEPIETKSSNDIEIQEVIEQEKIEEKELQPHIEVKNHNIKIPPELKKLGLEEVKTTSFPSYINIKLPLSDDKIMTGTHAPITSSLRWLAFFALFLLHQAHLGLKVVQGKVTRVVRR